VRAIALMNLLFLSEDLKKNKGKKKREKETRVKKDKSNGSFNHRPI
jgi:hypothetical protein